MLIRLLLPSTLLVVLPLSSATGEVVGNPNVTINGTLSVQGSNGSNGTLTATGNVNLGSGSSDNVNINGLIIGNGSGNNRLINQADINSGSATSQTIVTRGGGDARYLQLSDVSSTLSPYLLSSTASSTYLPITTASSTYVPKSGATITGPLTLSSSASFTAAGTTVFENTGSVTANGPVTINNTFSVNNSATTLAALSAGATSVASLSSSGNASIGGTLAIAKTYTSTTGTEFLSSAIATFNPGAANDQQTVAFQAKSQTSGTQNLTRSLALGGGLHAIEGRATHSGSGSVTAAVAVSGIVENTAAGGVTDAVALMGRTPVADSTGLVTNAYGLYLQDQKNEDVTGKGYGIYAAGTDNLHVLAGRVRVGAESDPTTDVELDVAGDAKISGNLGVDGVFSVQPKGGISMGIFTAQ